MSTSTLSFRASTEFAEQTKHLAGVFNMTSSDYVREAVREKNERLMKDRITHLSKQLSAINRQENEAMDNATGDGLV
jgi:hypothetical protein